MPRESNISKYKKIIKRARKDFETFSQIIGEIKIGKHQKKWLTICLMMAWI